jgi:hypothetical protein
VVAGEGTTLTEEMMPGVALGGLFDCVEVPEGSRVADPLESVVPGLSPLLAPPHPQLTSVREIRKITRRKSIDLPG